ncbi:MAG TPA: ABC transporter ATP-binding protein [Ktedonobacterales bacterium]|jgi:putative ABC transport system ATP-binding protein|nr:ABC transporter ATP-binding protein [Ktedonobacterales bacterium]
MSAVEEQSWVDEWSDPRMAIVRAEGLRKTYRAHGLELDALCDVDFSVTRGEMVAVMGPSGCGKTTLLNCLAGLDTIDAGRVLIDSVDLDSLSDARRADYRAQRMGFIFQNFNLLPVLSAVENVEMPLLLLRVSAGQARKRARALLDAVGLSHRERHRPAELSGGQRQRVAIARALVNDPAIVWADEPTGNLDTEAADEVMGLLMRLNHEREQTLVIVTHAPDISARAHRVIRMRDGRIVTPAA